MAAGQGAQLYNVRHDSANGERERALSLQALVLLEAVFRLSSATNFSV